MRQTQPDITLFIKEQFPEFYQEDGVKFIAFMQAYYAWMAETNNVDNLTDSIYNLRDIDRTIDDFVIFFKNKYLVNFNPNSETDIRKLVKHARELFGSKGTEESIRLLFQLLYNEEINIYYPGDDILRASDGKWYQPKYLELSPTGKTASFLSKQVIGSVSGAKAFVEGLVRKNNDGRIFDVAFISNVRGIFEAGEKLSVDGSLTDCPTVLGSVVDVDIISGSSNNQIGDIITISGGSGFGAKARVTSIAAATGKVNFNLNDGGSGYRLTSNVLISDTVMEVRLSTGDWQELETVTQPIQRVGYISGSGTLSNTIVKGLYANSAEAANGVIVASNSTYVIINTCNGDFSLADDLVIGANAWTSIIANTVNADATGIFLGYNTDNDIIGVAQTNNTFYANGSISGNSAGALINVIQTGNGAHFEIGTLDDTENVFLFTDLLDDVNEGGVPFMDIVLDGSNANTVGDKYGFPKPITGFATDIDSIITDALSSNVFAIGTIESITRIDPGNDYNADPFIKIYDPLVTNFLRYNIVVSVDNATGVFLPGERITQAITYPGYILGITYIANSPFVVDESVFQTSSEAKGQVLTINVTHTAIVSLNGIPFVNGQHIAGLTSTAVANVTSNTFAGANATAVGKVLAANLDTVVIQPRTLNEVFGGTNELLGETTGITANVVSISQNTNSEPMGLNANVTGRVVTANGVISTVSIIDSGFGFLDGEMVELVNENNPIISTGELVVDESGIGTGFWKNTDGFVGDKYIHDNRYYQVFSYEIQTGIALERYSAMLKNVIHTAGMSFYGKVVKVSVPDITPIDIESTVTTS